jgi:predicted alpha/beta hydrolase family esterase
MARILIMHGWTNRRQEGVWQRKLASALRQQGHQVLYPQFPNTDAPVLEEWQELLLAELDLLAEAGDGETIVIGHSLGCVNWIQAAAEGKIKTPVDRLLLVAPADPGLLGEVKGLKVNLKKRQVVDAALGSTKSLTLVGSDLDPWLPDGVQATYGDLLGVHAVILEGVKHFSLTDGFSDWQGVLNWVNDPAADLRIR